MIARLAYLVVFAIGAVCVSTAQLAGWPAESEESASNLSALSRAFRKDLSGATWNPLTRTLWLCRNGPGEDSRLWVLEENGEGGLRIASDGERSGEWREIGESEGVTFADFEEDVVYLIVEGEEKIHEIDVSVHGAAVLKRVYDTSPFLPLNGSDGAEGITFVPDGHLAGSDFVDSSGAPRVSRNGMGGLMLVGHQNGGGIYAFDLNRETGAVDLVGEYRVLPKTPSDAEALSKVVGLEFDRSTGLLYVWHGLRDSNALSVLDLSSHAVAGEGFRGFNDVRTFSGPSERNYEGIALVPAQDCGAEGRALFLTVDDGKESSLFRYDRFVLGCEGFQARDDSSPAGQVGSAAPGKKPAAESADADLWKMAFSLIGGLGLFLVGMRYLSDGMQALAGHRLRQMINAVTDNRFLAVGVGTGMTCLVQSSSITTVIVVGFVNSGLMQLRQAIGVIMGANIGTTITGWILVLKVGKYGLPILGLSAFFYLFSKRERWRYIAMVAMGLGMIFFGLELMKNGVKPMRSVPEFQAAFAWFAADGYLGVLKCAALGCLLTLFLQSSSATLGITISLAATGTIPFETAAALVLGENVGTTITAWLASLGATTAAKRAAYAHVVFNLVGVAWITLLFPVYIQLIGRFVAWEAGADVFGADFVPENQEIAFATIITFAIASVHTGFNVANTVLFLGFLRPFASLLERWMPDRGKEKPSLSLETVVSSPVLSLQNSHAVILKMANDVQEMLVWTRQLVSSDKPEEPLVRKVFQYEEMMDEVQSDVIEFLTNLLAAETPHETAIEARQQLRIVDEYESVSDYVSRVLKARLRIAKRGLNLNAVELERMLSLHDDVAAYLRLITKDFKDPLGRDLARALHGSEAISRTVKELRSQHLNSLSEGRVDPNLSMAFTTMLNSYRKVKDHALNIVESLAG